MKALVLKEIHQPLELEERPDLQPDGGEVVVKLKNAIDEGYDFIQGSRYLKGGGYGRLPIYRKVATRYIL